MGAIEQFLGILIVCLLIGVCEPTFLAYFPLLILTILTLSFRLISTVVEALPGGFPLAGYIYTAVILWLIVRAISWIWNGRTTFKIVWVERKPRNE